METEILGNKLFEQRLRSVLLEYVSNTNTRTMAPVRKNILQILIFLYGKDTPRNVGFPYSNDKDVANQQKKYILFAFLFMEDLKKNCVTATDLSTLQRMWDQHILYLANNGKAKAAENYQRILEDSEETIFNIKRFQCHLSKTRAFLAKYKDPQPQKLGSTFSFRKSKFAERMTTKLKKLLGQRDPDDFFMIKFQDVN
ncbi:uncharacterized protein LOC133192793 [Saccostrea echinata]|uniref:uncharacterized protein LOC133192793 n=1 Tax=Saccostrea echinata TaxID=191078 RepID=UPI002A834A13|nr:uncharacterized protein LOC133192793 [Saccostrea echinata]